MGMQTFSLFLFPLSLISCSPGSYTSAENRPSGDAKSRPIGEAVGTEKMDSEANPSSSPSSSAKLPVSSGRVPPVCPSLKLSSSTQENETADKVKIGTVLWKGSEEQLVQLTPGTDKYETSPTARASGKQVFGDVLPAATSSGWYLDVRLFQGFFSNPEEGADPGKNFVAWLGVSNRTSSFLWSETGAKAFFTGWYWSGDVWYPEEEQKCGSILEAGDYRIAMRLESSVPEIYFRKKGELPRGPFPVPSGELRLMMLPQGGFKFPSAQILNGGAIYQGSGGLF